MDKELLAAALAMDSDLWVPPHLRPLIPMPGRPANPAYAPGPSVATACVSPKPLPYEAVPLLYPYHDETFGG